MERDAIAAALEHAGLTGYQADVYLTLLEMGRSAAVEVGRNCSVPVPQVYDLLRELEEEGYVETMEQEKLYAQPHKPDDLLETLADRSELLDEAAEAIEDTYQEPDLADYRIGVAKHPETAFDHATDLIEEAETVVNISATYEDLERMFPELRDAKERGVVVRAAVYTMPEDPIPDSFDPSESISELRACTIPGPFLATIDRRRTCFSPSILSDETYGVLIQDRILPFVLNWFFLTCQWNNYETIYIDDESQVSYVSIEEFVRDFSPLHRDGYEIEVRISGVPPYSSAERSITGTVESMQYPLMGRHGHDPSLIDLSNYVTIVVDTGDEYVSAGGWGALVEDMEAHRIDLLAIRAGDEVFAAPDVRPGTTSEGGGNTPTTGSTDAVEGATHGDSDAHS